MGQASPGLEAHTGVFQEKKKAKNVLSKGAEEVKRTGNAMGD